MVSGNSGNNFKDIILDSVSDGISIDAEGKFLYVNETFAKMLDYSVTELTGMTVHDVTAPEYLKLITARGRKRQQGNEVTRMYEVDLVTRNGSRIPVELSVSRIDYEGKSSSLTIIRDISERVRSRLEYIPVFEILNEAIVMYDTEKYIWMNDAYAQLRGYDSPRELIGTSIYDGIHPSEIQENIRAIAERVRTGKGSEGFWRLKKKDGSYLNVIGYASILPSLDNQITVAIIRPAKESVLFNVSKGDFIHEIQSPLTVIQGYLSLIHEHENVIMIKEVDKWFDIINRNIVRIGEFVTRIGEE